MISIIIPTLNEEKVISSTISQFKELLIEHEVIISDGKSTDRTLEIAKNLGAKIYVHNKDHRQTIAEGRNDGADLAQGEYLVFLDADCKIPDINNFFAKALAYFETKKGLIGLAPSVFVMPELATISDKIIFGIRNWTYVVSNNLLHIHGAPGECLIIKKAPFMSIGGFRIDLPAAEDIDLFHRLGKVGELYFSKAITVLHTGRRAHKIGWPKLLWEWFINTVSLIFRHKAASKEWKEIR